MDSRRLYINTSCDDHQTCANGMFPSFRLNLRFSCGLKMVDADRVVSSGMSRRWKNVLLVAACCCCFRTAISTSETAGSTNQQPHIIMIVADDLGWNDVGFHGSGQVPTPNIDALALSGISLHNYYVQPICTPSRSAIMTGKYPIHTGMHAGVILAAQPYGVSLNETFLPQHLNSLGYTSHAVGKWHLGSYKEAYTPTARGFASHFGYWSGKKDYYDHTNEDTSGYWGYDLRDGMSVARAEFGSYTTDLFTERSVKLIAGHNASQPLFLYLAHLAVHSANSYAPLQAPASRIDKFSHIGNGKRRRFAAMLSKLDDSVGRVTAALHEKSMLQNSVIVFTTDNGGPAASFDYNAASNWPLRGVKNTLWEGGVRGAGFVWSPLLKTRSYVYNGMMHITDLPPTLFSLAGGNPGDMGDIDGMDLWPALSGNLTSPRHQILLNAEPRNKYEALISGKYKYIKGSNYADSWSGWYGPSGRSKSRYDLYNIMKTSHAGRALSALGMDVSEQQWNNLRNSLDVKCTSVPDPVRSCAVAACLFNLQEDPCEYRNLASQLPEVLTELKKLMKRYKSTMVDPRNKPVDPNANPKYWNYVWTNWGDFNSSIDEN